jgi:hypothetical protein
VSDPYAIGLAEFAVMRGDPPSPAAEPGLAEGRRAPIKDWLSRRTDQADPILSGFEAARMQLHVREARAMAGLAVVHVPAEDDPNLDTLVVSGHDGRVIGWLRKLARMGVAASRYAVELPPAAREEGDEDAWADSLADRLDEPGVSFSVRISDNDDQWQAGLP